MGGMAESHCKGVWVQTERNLWLVCGLVWFLLSTSIISLLEKYIVAAMRTCLEDAQPRTIPEHRPYAAVF